MTPRKFIKLTIIWTVKSCVVSFQSGWLRCEWWLRLTLLLFFVNQ